MFTAFSLLFFHFLGWNWGRQGEGPFWEERAEPPGALRMELRGVGVGESEGDSGHASPHCLGAALCIPRVTRQGTLEPSPLRSVLGCECLQKIAPTNRLGLGHIV